MKIKFSDYGRCLVCLKNPCQCAKEKAGKEAIEPHSNAKCPNCDHEFDFSETFAWLADDDGHPTIESLTCPYCGIGTTSMFECSMCVGNTKGKFKCNLEEECSACATVSYDDFFKKETTP